MADYYSLLARAVAALPQPTREARQGVYERARKALFNQLRGIQPPVAEADILAEGRALDDAIARIEAEIPASAPSQPEAAKIVASPAPPPPAAPARPAPPPRPAAPPLSARVAPPPARPGVDPVARPAPGQPLAPKASEPADKAKAPAGALKEKETSWLRRPEKPAAPEAAQPASEREPAPRAPEPPRERQRPAAPLPPAPEPVNGSRRLLAILAILVLFVGVVALAAWQLREKPEDLSKLKPEDAATESAETGKFAERVDGGTAPDQRAPRGGKTALPVAQKAELWVASSTEPNKVDKIYSGTVLWRLDNVGGGSGQPVGSAVRGEIDVPDAKLKLTLLFQKNEDATVSFSHTVNVGFTVAPGGDLKGVKAIGPIQMRRPDAQSGEKLVGIPVPITDNNFLIGLMRGDREARNLYLLRSNMVLDLPLQLSDGRAATINMEKGPSGERAFADALDAWGQKPTQ